MKRNWYAVYTKPRNEKKVAERLSHQGFEVYCPVQTTIKQWSDRKKKVQIPIFPSYVFVCVYEVERKLVLQDAGVLNFVFYLGKAAIIKEEELNTIKVFLGELEDKTYDLSLKDYKTGDEVDIIAGPLSGMKGLVEDSKKSNLRLLIKSLGTIIKVDINKASVI